jgi:ATP-binding cassette subfamily B protein
MQIFQLDQLGTDEKNVLDLEVGENGKRLSGGQIKRVALIRSLMSGADFYFWDDPFSSIDIILEKKIIKYLQSHTFWKSQTFFISSHRLTTVKLSHYLILLKKDFGIQGNGAVENEVKEDYFVEFFKEQMVEHSLD